MTLYMTVTGDKYEFPILIEESAAKLARMLGVKPNLVYSSIAHKKEFKRDK